MARRTVYLNFPGGKAELVAEATRIAGDATLTVAAVEGAVILAIATQSTAALDDVGRHLI